MRTVPVVLLAILLNLFNAGLPGQDKSSTKKDIYHSGWTDLNKNGRMDVYENPKADINKRLDDLLSQMTLEEKTCQTRSTVFDLFPQTHHVEVVTTFDLLQSP